MRKFIVVIVCLALVGFGLMYFFLPEKTTPHLTQFFSKQHKEVQRIQDWLSYQQQQQLLLVDVLTPVSPKQQSAYVDYIKQKIELNQQNIQRLKLSHYQSKAFKELQQLEIHALEQWNDLFQTHIVDAYAEQQHFVEIPAEEYQQIHTEARYALQQQEILILKQLQHMLEVNSPYLSDIDPDLLGDWTHYQLMQHEIHPVISEWLKTEVNTPPPSRQEAMQELRIYKRFQPRTDEYKYIMSLQTQLWHTEHPSSNLVKTTTSVTEFEMDQEILVPEDEPQAEQIKKLIQQQHAHVSQMLSIQLNQAFLKKA